MAYAEKTEVAVEKSIAEIVALVKRAGAQRVMQADEPERFAIQFEMKDRLVRFRVTLPSLADVPARSGNGPWRDDKTRARIRDQMHRQRARALLLVVKAKLESIESGVETFEEAFLANVVMANGQTIYERVREPIALEYRTGAVQATSTLFLEGPSR